MAETYISLTATSPNPKTLAVMMHALKQNKLAKRMKNFLTTFIIIIGIVYSCQNENNVYKPQKKIGIDEARVYFKECIAYDGELAYSGISSDSNNFQNFSINKLGISTSVINRYDALIFGLEEDYVDTSDLPNKDSWIRFTIDPIFRIPYCLIIEKKNGLTYLTGKMTDGCGGYYPGYLNFSITQTFPDTLFDYFSKRLKDINFFKLGDEKDNIADGEGWTIEFIENDNYNLVERRSPNNYGSPATKHLGKIGLELKKISKIIDAAPVLDSLDDRTLKWLYYE